MGYRSFIKWLGLIAVLCGGSGPAKAESRNVAFTNELMKFNAKVGVEFRIADLKSLLSSQGTSGNLVWSTSTDRPAWVKLDSAASTMWGTPTKDDIKVASFRLFVQDDENGAIGRIEITVTSPPIWTQQNIDLGIQNEGTAMTPFDLKTKLQDSAGVTFTSPNLPSWMKLSTDGIITGTPARPNVGDYSGVIFIATGGGGSAQATGFGKVLKTIKPPKWVGNPIPIDDAFEDAGYSKSVKDFVLNFENTALKFEPVSLPSWLQISSTGTLFGTPKKTDVGPAQATVLFRTTIDGTEYTDTTTFTLKVIHVNHAPKWVSNPITLPDAFTKILYKQDLSKSASDPDTGDTLSFRMISGPSWATLSATGQFSGTPQKENVGSNSFQVEVKDNAGLVDVTTVLVTVIKSPEPPYWLSKPTVLPKAKEDFSYTADLQAYVGNPDSLPLTFTLLSGPAWAKVSATGTLSGTPRASDLPMSKFSIKVANSAGSDIADVLIEIEATNHAPQWLLNPVRITVQEKKAMSVSVAPYAKDQDAGDVLSFQLLNGPAWAQLSTAGLFTGTPQKKEVGDNLYNVRVLDKAGLSADVQVIITVIRVNDPPKWTQDPITLPNAKEDLAYAQSVKEFAVDADNDPLTFSKVSGPEWLSIASDGSVTGTPRRSDVGVNEFKVRVMDTSNEFAIATVKITVEKVNKAPRWRQDPILMSDAYEDKNYNFDLTPYAVDDDGDALTFSLVQGPTWMKVSANGIVSGVPSKVDVGPFSATFQVSDGKLNAQANGKANVIHTNHAPEVGAIPVLHVKEYQVLKTNLAQYVTDKDGDKITFSIQNAPNWVTLFSTGDLTLNPVHANLGTHQVPFQVDDGTLKTVGTMTIIVDPDPQPPKWILDPIRMEAKTNENFSNTLFGKAVDRDGATIKYSKKSGSNWLVVAAAGDLSGIPRDADIGENTFTVTACNPANLCADATLIITVKPGITIDTVQIDTPVAGAEIDNLWIVDSSDVCSNILASLKKNIGYYFNMINAAGLHHASPYLSSEAKKWDGQPVKNKSGNWIMLWSDPNNTSDFLERLDIATRDLDMTCSNCYNSPLWSMFRFYQQLPSFSFYHQTYFKPSVPMDAMIVTQQRDHYPVFSANTPQKNWGAADYAASFMATHAAENKSYRISAIAPECPKLISQKGEAAAPENAYRVVVGKTQGTYYAPTDCSYNVKPFLEDYAKKVIFRAYVHAKTRIPLSKKPLDPTQIKVSVGGVLLPGNTGAPTDKWRFEPSGQNGEIVLIWYLIDQGQLKPGDQIKIEYRVS